MRKRLFFIVNQLNIMGSAELAAVSFTSYLNQEYDIFIYSIEKIEGGKVNPGYNIHPRVTIRSLNLPSDEDEQKVYLKENGDNIADLLSLSSRDDDVFVLFSDRLINHIRKDVKKILIKGFSRTKDYDSFDRVVFLTKQEFMEEVARDTNLKAKASYLTPFSRFEHLEDYKFHGNKIMCITRLIKNLDLSPLYELAESLKASNLKFLISVSSDGFYKECVEKEILEKHLEDVIELRPIEDTKNLYGESDLFFYFSKNHHYPLFLVESLSCSLPVISYSNNSYVKDILSNVGIITSSIEEAKNKIISLFNDKIKLAKLKFETFEYSKRFLKDNALKEFKKIIAGLINIYD